MVLVLVTGAVVEEDGSAWVWGRREGRHAPWAASSAALGVAVLRGMNYYQGGGDPNSLGFVASPPEDGAWAWWRRGSCDCGDCCARGDGGEDGEGGEGEGEGGGGGDGDGDGEGDGEGEGELAEASVDGGEWEVGVGACGRSVAWAAAHRAVGP